MPAPDRVQAERRRATHLSRLSSLPGGIVRALEGALPRPSPTSLASLGRPLHVTWDWRPCPEVILHEGF